MLASTMQFSNNKQKPARSCHHQTPDRKTSRTDVEAMRACTETNNHRLTPDTVVPSGPNRMLSYAVSHQTLKNFFHASTRRHPQYSSQARYHAGELASVSTHEHLRPTFAVYQATCHHKAVRVAP